MNIHKTKIEWCSHIKNPEEQCSEQELILSKNKEGVTGKMTLTFQGQYQTFYQQEDNRYE